MEPPDCGECEKPALLPANQGAKEVFWQAAAVLQDGWGGVNLDNARLVALALDYDWDAALVKKLIYLVRLLLKKEEIPDEEPDGEE